MKHLMAAAALAIVGLAPQAGAQGPAAPAPKGFSVVYDVHAKGITAGRFSYSVSRTGDSYQAKADRRMTGLVRTFVGNRQDYRYAASGLVTADGVKPVSYEHIGGKKNRRVDVNFTLTDVVTVATPPMGMGDPPATQAQRVGALDQLSSIYEMALSDADPCTRTLHVFLDGRSRFDLAMTPNGTEKVSMAGFKGVARRCSVQYRPIAGFSDPQEPATLTFLFASIGGFYAPLRIAMPTDDAGIVTLTATAFSVN